MPTALQTDAARVFAGMHKQAAVQHDADMPRKGQRLDLGEDVEIPGAQERERIRRGGVPPHFDKLLRGRQLIRREVNAKAVLVEQAHQIPAVRVGVGQAQVAVGNRAGIGDGRQHTNNSLSPQLTMPR